jgi:DNA-binding XRE family transcriptional regulator
LTQKEAASLVGATFWTFQNYEDGQSSPESFVGNNILKALTEYQSCAKGKGVLPFSVVKEKASSVLAGFKVDISNVGKNEESLDAIDFRLPQIRESLKRLSPEFLSEH